MVRPVILLAPSKRSAAQAKLDGLDADVSDLGSLGEDGQNADSPAPDRNVTAKEMLHGNLKTYAESY